MYEKTITVVCNIVKTALYSATLRIKARPDTRRRSLAWQVCAFLLLHVRSPRPPVLRRPPFLDY